MLLGSETRRLMFSDLRVQMAASDVLEGLRIPIRDTTRLVGELPDGQRRLIAIARALTSRPRLLCLMSRRRRWVRRRPQIWSS